MELCECEVVGRMKHEDNLVFNKTTINYYIKEIKRSINELKEDIHNCKYPLSKKLLTCRLNDYESDLELYISQAKYWRVYKDE